MAELLVLQQQLAALMTKVDSLTSIDAKVTTVNGVGAGAVGEVGTAGVDKVVRGGVVAGVDGGVEDVSDCSSGMSGSSWAEDVEAELYAKDKVGGGNGAGAVVGVNATSCAGGTAAGDGSGGAVVVMPVRPSTGVRPVINFHGQDEETGFFATYVRTAEVKALSRFLRKMGVVIAKECRQELALSRYSAANVPAAFKQGQQRLRSLAKVGDAVLTAVKTDSLYYQCVPVAEVQARCAQVLSRSALSAVAVRSGLAGYVSFPAGVDRVHSCVAGEALEAVAAVVYHSAGMEGVKLFMTKLGL